MRHVDPRLRSEHSTGSVVIGSPQSILGNARVDYLFASAATINELDVKNYVATHVDR